MKWKQPEGGFKEFMIGDLFEGQTGDVDLQQQDVNGKGCYFINSGVQNCGIKGRTDRMAKVFPSNTITVDFFGNAYYRPFEYKMATHNHVFSLSGDVIKNEHVGLYLVAQMSYLAKMYSFNEMGTWPKIREHGILLPVDKKGEIDFDYIESRIRELEESRIRELEAYLIAAGFEDCVLTQSECDALRRIHNHTISLKEYKIGDIFDDATGRDIIIRDTKEGTVPLISHQHDNNGISRYIAPIEGRRIFSYKDTLSLADRGVFLATTQNHNFHIGTRVKALTFKDGEKSESVRLFFVAAINKLQIMFSEYLTNATDSLPSLNIMLPVADDGTIDFDFMDTYISAIKKQCIATLKQEISREHQAYEQAVEPTPAESETEKEESKIVVLPTYREGCIPLYTLRAACGYFEGGEVPEEEGWIDASGNGFTPDPKRHFAVHAKGNSMQPKIQDGDICVFEWYNDRAGSREGDIVLSMVNEHDNDFGGPYTIKKYHSEKVQTEEGWQHTKIELIPLNNNYDTIELDSDKDYRTIGVLKCVMSKE